MTEITAPAGGNGRAGADDAPAVPAVEMRGITRAFGTLLACDRIDLRVDPGRITGLLGENGAGKSTLMKVLLGLMRPDEGSIHIDGREVVVRDPQTAASLGLAMVHQHLSLVGPLTVWENVTLGERGRVDAPAARRRVREVGDRYGIAVDPNEYVQNLAAGMRQRVELIKCLARDPHVLILDEPTSVLTALQSRDLFEVLRRVVDEERRAVVLISHKLDEILHSTDDVVILRRGRVVARHRSEDVDAPTLAREMVGREVSLSSETEAAALGVHLAQPGEGERERGRVRAPGAAAPPEHLREAPVVLSIRDAVAHGSHGVTLLDGICLELRAGEVLGLAGVDGNGQVALQDVLSNLLPLSSGTVSVQGAVVRTGRAGLMQRARVSVIPEDRHRSGCILDMSITENLVLGDIDDYTSSGLLAKRRMRRRALELIGRYQIQCSSPEAPMRSLSGGNQQRVVLAREISRGPAVLVAANVTRGLDVGAIEYVTGCLQAAARDGVGILLISAELDELLALSDRIAVIHRGRILGDMLRSEADVERIGLLMGGQAA